MIFSAWYSEVRKDKGPALAQLPTWPHVKGVTAEAQEEIIR
jgi:hypothetical protein